MEAKKQWEMNEETQRNDKAKDPKEQNTISNTSNKCGTTKGRPEEENFSQEHRSPKNIQHELPPTPMRHQKNLSYFVLLQHCFIVRGHVRPCSKV